MSIFFIKYVCLLVAQLCSALVHLQVTWVKPGSRWHFWGVTNIPIAFILLLFYMCWKYPWFHYAVARWPDGLLACNSYCHDCRFSVLWRCWLGIRKGIRPVKTEWWGAGMVICLLWGANLHTAQLMPLPLTVSCFSKIHIGFTFLVPAHPGSLGQRANKRVCVCVVLGYLTQPGVIPEMKEGLTTLKVEVLYCELKAVMWLLSYLCFLCMCICIRWVISNCMCVCVRLLRLPMSSKLPKYISWDLFGQTKASSWGECSADCR